MPIPVLNEKQKPAFNRHPIQEEQESIVRRKPLRTKTLRKIFLIFFVLLLIFTGGAIWKLNAIGGKIFNSRFSFFQQAADFITGNRAGAMDGENQDQINILLLGYGGEGHDGPYLTDSMLLASVRPADKKIILTSIPRDYYYPSGLGEKINAAFPSGFGNQYKITGRDLENGGAAAEAAVEKLSGMNIPYFVSMDFQGFEDAVNRVGGIRVDVQNSFTDYAFPNGDNNASGPWCMAPPGDTTSACRYIEVHFDAGPQTMNGLTALQFVRSRHAQGVEGTDFARGKRQQLVLEAFKNKMEQLNLFSNASDINDLINILANHLHTNLTLAQANHLFQIFRQPGMQVISQSLDPDTGLVCNGKLPTDGADIVQPCGGISDSQIAQFFQNGFETAPVRNERAGIILENYNASYTEYQQIKKEIKDAGIVVYETPYHYQPLNQSVIYTVDSKPNTQAFLEKLLNVTAEPLPSNMRAEADLVVVIADNGSQGSN